MTRARATHRGLPRPSAASRRWRALGLLLAALALAAAAGEEKGSTFQGEGKVLAVNEAKSTLSLDHGPIPGLMPAMRMRFAVRDRRLLRGIKVGDAVRFTLGTRGTEVVIVGLEPLPPGQEPQ